MSTQFASFHFHCFLNGHGLEANAHRTRPLRLQPASWSKRFAVPDKIVTAMNANVNARKARGFTKNAAHPTSIDNTRSSALPDVSSRVPETAQFTPGSLCNEDSTDFLMVFCPIVRDDVAAEDGTYEIVVNINQAAAGPSSCAAVSYTADHEVIEAITAYAVENGKTTLHVDLNASVPDGYYDLFCGLAPGSCLYSYRVYEWEGRHDEMTDYDR